MGCKRIDCIDYDENSLSKCRKPVFVVASNCSSYLTAQTEPVADVLCNVGLSDNEALLIKKLIEEQEKRVVHCEKVLNGKFGRFQRLNALNSIKLLKRILSEGR